MPPKQEEWILAPTLSSPGGVPGSGGGEVQCTNTIHLASMLYGRASPLPFAPDLPFRREAHSSQMPGTALGDAFPQKLRETQS